MIKCITEVLKVAERGLKCVRGVFVVVIWMSKWGLDDNLNFAEGLILLVVCLIC